MNYVYTSFLTSGIYILLVVYKTFPSFLQSIKCAAHVNLIQFHVRNVCHGTESEVCLEYNTQVGPFQMERRMVIRGSAAGMARGRL